MALRLLFWRCDRINVIELDDIQLFLSDLGSITYSIDIPIQEERMDITIKYNPTSTLYNSNNYKKDNFCPMYNCMWISYKWDKYKALKVRREKEFK